MSINKPQSRGGLGTIRDLFRSAPPSPTSPSRRRVSLLVRRGRDIFFNSLDLGPQFDPTGFPELGKRGAAPNRPAKKERKNTN
ncbi:unnamed protein product [Penicillium camemberti]|uniref:Str. FM013 n=1 Tax=Penicillium camemberti (strain FM 013) TaxID=1429867 RepID=A0A0G4NY29_PENC3|nr:unnamed protein product [Penicillium camemberti]